MTTKTKALLFGGAAAVLASYALATSVDSPWALALWCVVATLACVAVGRVTLSKDVPQEQLGGLSYEDRVRLFACVVAMAVAGTLAIVLSGVVALLVFVGVCAVCLRDVNGIGQERPKRKDKGGKGPSEKKRKEQEDEGDD